MYHFTEFYRLACLKPVIAIWPTIEYWSDQDSVDVRGDLAVTQSRACIGL